jgi:hypothetical protein
MLETNGHPRQWDPAKVREAFADVEQLVAALGRDESGDAFRATLDPILERIFDAAGAEQQAADRLAYTLYGATLFGLSAITTAEILGNVRRSNVLELIHRTLDMWLEQSGGATPGG